MPGGVDARGFDWVGVLYLVLVLVVLFTPVLFARRGASSSPEDGSDEGRGGGSRRPKLPPRGPIGGPPLPDARQSRTRLRDHGRLKDLAGRHRRGLAHRPRRRERTVIG